MIIRASPQAWRDAMVRVPPARPRTGSRTFVATALTLVLALVLAACGRSSGGGGSHAQPTSGAASGSAASASPGDFGTLKKICGPGSAKGATGRGVTDSTIRIGTTADPGAAAAPGLEQEFFDTADAFSKWCNAAGGINGRRIVLDKWDAKLFEVGAQLTNACLQDFFLVGNGNAFDSAGVKTRLACKLGQIPAYVVSPEAVSAGLQVQPTPIPPTQINDGGLRLLTEAYPEVKAAGVGIGSSTLASIAPIGLRTREYLQKLGIKVAVLQARPPLVDNYRPYMEEMKGAGAKGYYEISAQDPSPEIQAMKNVGWTPSYILYSAQFYGPQAVAEAKATPQFPPSYVQFGALPFELDNQFPVLKQVEGMVAAAVTKPRLTSFTLSSFSAWALFAQSATACGSTLTVDCVLSKASDHPDWTGGGLYATHDIRPGASASPCIAMVKLTPTGFEYDKTVTKPTHSVFNCDPANVARVKAYQ